MEDKSKDTKAVSRKNTHDGHRERLRQKFDMDRELTSMLPHEMLEFILSLVIPRKDTKPIAYDLLAKFHSLHTIFDSKPEDLKQVKGMTVAASYLLASIYPIFRKSLRSQEKFEITPKITNPIEAANYMQPFFLGRTVEKFLIIYLNIDFRIVFQEWINGSNPDYISVDERAILKRAGMEGAKYVIIGHNHPTERKAPSKDDIRQTSKLFALLKSSDIWLMDAQIFSDDGFFSFRNNGFLSKFDTDWRIEKSAKHMHEDDFYGRIYDSDVREFVLDYIRLRDEFEMYAISKEEFGHLSEEDFKLKNKNKPIKK